MATVKARKGKTKRKPGRKPGCKTNGITIPELLPMLGISRGTFYKYKKLPGWPAGESIESMVAFVAKTRSGTTGDEKDFDDLSGIEIQRRRAIAELRLKDKMASLKGLEEAEKRGQLIAIEDVKANRAQIATTLKTSLLDVPAIVFDQCHHCFVDSKAGAEVRRVIDERMRDAIEAANRGLT